MKNKVVDYHLAASAAHYFDIKYNQLVQGIIKMNNWPFGKLYVSNLLLIVSIFAAV